MASTGYLTSSSLIETIKREGMIPTSQNTFSDNDFLAMANQEIKIGLVPSIMQYHEEYLVIDSDDITLVANKSNYSIPYRAIGNKFREVFYKDQSGNLRAMSRISPDHRPFYQQSGLQSQFVHFYIKGNDVVLVPDVGSNPVGSIIFSYWFKPNDLVSESRVSTITSISTGASTTTYAVDFIPQNLQAFVQDGVTLTSFSSLSKLDLLQRKPGHKTVAFDIYPTSVDTTNKTITFSSNDVDTSVVAGDYVAFAGECIIPQIPSDLHDVLAHRVMMRAVQALGDTNAYQIASTKLNEMEKNTGILIDNRSEGNPQKINNIRGPLRAAKFQSYRRVR